MDESKNWALIAKFFDRSFACNRVTYYPGGAVGLAYTPRLAPAEVVMDGEYKGLYYLSETVRMEESRIDINGLEDFLADDEKITGGFLISSCRTWDADSKDDPLRLSVSFS